MSTFESPVWSSLATAHARFALSTERARRFQPEVAPFVAIDERSIDEGLAELEKLVDQGERVMLVSTAPIELGTGWSVDGGGWGFQMHAPAERVAGWDGEGGVDIVALHADDVPDMTALVALTEPGPFRPRTIELGNYYGVKERGRLVAMAGERLQTPEFTEISAVCTHPDGRGRGLASMLTAHVASRITRRGQIPILHVAEWNTSAQRVYERLGFTIHRKIQFTALRRTADGIG